MWLAVRFEMNGVMLSSNNHRFFDNKQDETTAIWCGRISGLWVMTKMMRMVVMVMTMRMWLCEGVMVMMVVMMMMMTMRLWWSDDVTVMVKMLMRTWRWWWLCGGEDDCEEKEEDDVVMWGCDVLMMLWDDVDEVDDGENDDVHALVVCGDVRMWWCVADEDE